MKYINFLVFANKYIYKGIMFYYLIMSKKPKFITEQLLKKYPHTKIDDKTIYFLSKKNIPPKKVIQKVYRMIPDDKKIPIVFETKQQYLKEYIKNQEYIHKTDFSPQQENEYVQSENINMRPISSRFTTFHNKYIEPRVVFFTDIKHTPQSFKENALHEYGHEKYEKEKLKKKWKFSPKTSPTLYGKTDKEEDFAESYALFKDNQSKQLDSGRQQVLQDVTSKNRANWKLVPTPLNPTISNEWNGKQRPIMISDVYPQRFVDPLERHIQISSGLFLEKRIKDDTKRVNEQVERRQETYNARVKDTELENKERQEYIDKRIKEMKEREQKYYYPGKYDDDIKDLKKSLPLLKPKKIPGKIRGVEDLHNLYQIKKQALGINIFEGEMSEHDNLGFREKERFPLIQSLDDDNESKNIHINKIMYERLKNLPVFVGKKQSYVGSGVNDEFYNIEDDPNKTRRQTIYGIFKKYPNLMGEIEKKRVGVYFVSRFLDDTTKQKSQVDARYLPEQKMVVMSIAPDSNQSQYYRSEKAHAIFHEIKHSDQDLKNNQLLKPENIKEYHSQWNTLPFEQEAEKYAEEKIKDVDVPDTMRNIENEPKKDTPEFEKARMDYYSGFRNMTSDNESKPKIIYAVYHPQRDFISNTLYNIDPDTYSNNDEEEKEINLKEYLKIFNRLKYNLNILKNNNEKEKNKEDNIVSKKMKN